jgi:hypothetical protein
VPRQSGELYQVFTDDESEAAPHKGRVSAMLLGLVSLIFKANARFAG